MVINAENILNRSIKCITGHLRRSRTRSKALNQEGLNNSRGK